MIIMRYFHIFVTDTDDLAFSAVDIVYIGDIRTHSAIEMSRKWLNEKISEKENTRLKYS